MKMDAEMSKALRAPFGAEQISKLPRITCPECRGTKGTKVCAKHSKSTCPECGGYITEKHIHLDYVGHADVTDRLLAVDPEWDWKPLVEDEAGLPVITRSSDGQHIMWIKLTIGGMTRLGVGSVPPDSVDVEKQLIGDAIRNAAMRFGVALDLWSKAERGEPIAHEEGKTAAKPVMVEFGETAQGDASAAGLPSEGVPGETIRTATTGRPETPAGAVVMDASEFGYDDEPLPEYHGDDDWDGEWNPTGDGLGRSGGVAQVQLVKAQSAGAQGSNGIAHRGHAGRATQGIVASANVAGSGAQACAGPAITEPQKTGITAMLDELGIAQGDRKRYVVQIVGREVGSIGELSRSEGIAMMRWLVKERERRAGALQPVAAAGGAQG